jgi:lysozyme
MQYSKDGLALTEQFEGCRLTAYQDSAGLWTIGYGHRSALVRPGMVWTQAQAEEALAEDINWANNVVNSLVHASLTQSEHDALVDFVFNIGAGNFAKSEMLKALNEKNMVLAAIQFERWDMAGGKVIAGLLRRRDAEERMFTGTDK